MICKMNRRYQIFKRKYKKLALLEKQGISQKRLAKAA
jgi:hypothetical protein